MVANLLIIYFYSPNNLFDFSFAADLCSTSNKTAHSNATCLILFLTSRQL